MNRKLKLGLWDFGCIFWIAMAGSMLHFAYELSDYWKPMALMGAVNESAWEHMKMYFWPGLAYALVQYTYTRDIANNYWFGKAMALATTPVVIFFTYFGYMEYSSANGTKPSLAIMIGIMLFGIFAGQAASFFILSSDRLQMKTRRYAAASYASLIVMFSTFTFFPPKTFLFENFFCYEYTGEFGILSDYRPYRVFTGVDKKGKATAGSGVNYCENQASNKDVVQNPGDQRVSARPLLFEEKRKL